MDREIEALNQGRFEEASSCLRLIEQHAALGKEGLSNLLKGSGG